jgi:hypothetical protein
MARCSTEISFFTFTEAKYLPHRLIKKNIARLISEKSDKKHHNP